MKRSLSSLIENTDVREFKVVDIEVEKISESKTQARTYFDEKKLSELSESIKKSGVLQPIIVQLLGNDRYQLIAGERRLRASKAAGLKTIPCLVKDVTDKDAAVLGLVENVQRSQLNTIEEALGYKSLKEKYGLTLIIIEHILKVAMDTCSKVTVLDHGEKIAEGTPTQIKDDNAVIEAYLGKKMDDEEMRKALAV